MKVTKSGCTMDHTKTKYVDILIDDNDYAYAFDVASDEKIAQALPEHHARYLAYCNETPEDQQEDLVGWLINYEGFKGFPGTPYVDGDVK